RLTACKHDVPSLPPRDPAFEHRHSELGLDEASALFSHACVLNDAVARLVFAYGVEDLHGDTNSKVRHGLGLVGLVVANLQLDRLAVRVDRIDDDEIGSPLETRMLWEKAGLILRPAGDAQHVFAPERGRDSVKLGNGRAAILRVAPIERGTPTGQDCICLLPD